MAGGDLMEDILKNKKEVVDFGSFIRRFEFETVELREMEPITVDGSIGGVRIGNNAFFVTKRFMKTMMSLFGFAESLFQYFSPEELFSRIIERKKETALRLCIDRKRMQVNGVSDATNEILPMTNVCRIVREDPRLTEIRYDPETTLMESALELDDEWEISKDSKYGNLLYFSYPVDQCQTPTIALGLIRMVCTNGLIARKKCFETDLVIEKNHGRHLQQLLKCFNNRNGFDALRERMQIAQNTKASVNEFLGVVNTMKSYIKNHVPFVERLHDIAGHPENQYGQTRLENIRSRHRSELPTQASVMDLLNVLTETATHFLPDKHLQICAYATNLLANEFDLEELAKNKRPSQDFYLKGLPHGD